MSYLHSRSIRIFIQSYDFYSVPLQFDCNFFT